MPPPLNPAQLEASEHMHGPLLVLAGAGSGKTRVITHRIARLIERGVPAKAILALTFTNKAAGEMAERVQHVLKERGSKVSAPQVGRAKGGAREKGGVTISTFHSFGLQVLSRERKALGGTFTIFDQGDQLACVKDILARVDTGRAYDASAIISRISNAKNAFLSPEDFREREGDEYDDITKVVYPRYEAALRNFRAFDFDDLVCQVGRVWGEKKDVLQRWKDQYRFLLVDEYQDTNGSQLVLLRMLAEDHKNLCVVGDDDQSIYAWRGADVRNILEFEKHFPGAKVVKLEQNYRSSAPILAVANAVIHKRVEDPALGLVRHKKTLFTDKPGGEIVRSAIAPSPEAEAAHVAKGLKVAISDEGRKPRDLAVLYRSNGQAKLIEETLREHQIPHKVVGGQQFFERKEVKDVLAYLKLALNRTDEISLRRVLNYPPRGIGETSVERLTLHSLAKGWTLWQTIERVDALNDIPAAAREGCKAFEKLMAETRKRLLVERIHASEVARELCDKTGIKKDIELTSGGVQQAARRWGNVESLFRTFKNRETREMNKGSDAAHEAALAAFLHALTLNFDDEEADSGDRVTLSTLHGAKGLEFDVVYLIGCEEGLLPHSRTLDAKATDATPQDIEEERRLFYVGVTRARQRLVMSRAKYRLVRGKPMPRTPSRFLLEVPEELLETYEVKDIPGASREEAAAAADNILAMLGGLGDS
jgi:DNA helicase-2/ATP-dependent DNA helicase PcrA